MKKYILVPYDKYKRLNENISTEIDDSQNNWKQQSDGIAKNEDDTLTVNTSSKEVTEHLQSTHSAGEKEPTSHLQTGGEIVGKLPPPGEPPIENKPIKIFKAIDKPMKGKLSWRDIWSMH